LEKRTVSARWPIPSTIKDHFWKLNFCVLTEGNIAFGEASPHEIPRMRISSLGTNRLTPKRVCEDRKFRPNFTDQVQAGSAG
jgi:hypothetical protein